MVSKKSLKNKVSAPIKRNSNNSSPNCSNNRSIFVSQKIIISSIFDKSLLEQDVKADLPANVGYIFNHMLSDVAHINETLTKKDYSYYDCNMTFLDGETMISTKKQALMEFMMKKEKKRTAKAEKMKKMKANKKIKNESKEKSKEANFTGESSSMLVSNKKEVIDDKNQVDDEKCSEKSSETNFGLRPQRKRKKPMKFENEDKSHLKIDIESKSDSKDVQEADQEEEGCDEEIELRLVLEKPKLGGKSKSSRRVQNDVASKQQLINLVDGNSTDGSDNLKSKVYFREPVTRKPVKMSHKRLKEHTLLDKILLGINCVRKWTDKGLHLSRLCETDLALLNKRLTSLDCVLADLEEHTDENNNRYLSVLLKSDLFSSLVVPTPHKTSEVVATPAAANHVVKETNVELVDGPPETVSYGRQKSKQHIPALYRQRHAVPSILSKPSVKHDAKSTTTTSKESSLSSKSANKPDDFAFAAVKFEESSAKIASTMQPVDPTEPQMTASQLLRLKSQKFNFDASQKSLADKAQDEPQRTNATGMPQFTIANGIVRDAGHPLVYHQSGARGPPQFLNNPIPVIILPSNSQFIQTTGLSNMPVRQQIRAAPMSKSFHTVTKIQRIPLHDVRQPTVPPNFSQPRMSIDPASAAARATNHFPAQSVILKNLLQQSNTQIMNPTAISSDKMMPLSVFQNSKQPKRPFVPFNHYSIHKG